MSYCTSCDYKHTICRRNGAQVRTESIGEIQESPRATPFSGTSTSPPFIACNENNGLHLHFKIELKNSYFPELGQQSQHTDSHWLHNAAGAEVRKEWRYTSSRPICLHGVDRDQFSFTLLLLPLLAAKRSTTSEWFHVLHILLIFLFFLVAFPCYGERGGRQTETDRERERERDRLPGP